MPNGNIENALLHAILGDIIGFGNGITEFNNGKIFSKENYTNFVIEGANYSNELVFNFIYNGGFVEHPKPNMIVSDDTIMLLANCKALIKVLKGKPMKKSFLNEYIDVISESTTDNSYDRFINIYKGGITTGKNLQNLQNGLDYLKFPYSSVAGGSGGSMRSGIIGAIYYRTTDLVTLLETCIETTLMTHPNTIAFLGSVVVALFASYIMRDEDIKLWISNMLDILEGNVIDDIVISLRPDFEPYYMRDKLAFINKWKNYHEDRFVEGSLEYKRNDSLKYPSVRSHILNSYSSRTNDMYPGAGGDDSVILAFDSLISCNGSLEQIVIYSMLHVGDSDTTGCICGFLYGLMYERGPISDIMINNIKSWEFKGAKKVINELVKLL